jgi:hypothetical protein
LRLRTTQISPPIRCVRPETEEQVVTTPRLKTGADSVKASAPRELFAPLTVIVNWQALLKQTASRP